jgi:hypothetical protein
MNLKSMKKTLIVLFTACVIMGMSYVRADAQSTELGVIVGEPTGLSAKFWTSGNSAIDFAAAWSSGGDTIHIHSNYLAHMWLNNRSAFYVGLGGRVLLKDSSELAARVPLGLQINLARGRLGLFMELAPMLDIIPETGSGIDINGALGLRFRF